MSRRDWEALQAPTELMNLDRLLPFQEPSPSREEPSRDNRRFRRCALDNFANMGAMMMNASGILASMGMIGRKFLDVYRGRVIRTLSARLHRVAC